MRMRTFQAATMTEAMQLVRDALGDDAIIVSTHESGRGRGVQVTAAVEDPSDAPAQPEAGAAPPEAPSLEQLREALSFHGVPQRCSRRLLLAAAESRSEDLTEALAGALDRYIGFCPLSRTSRPLMLVGPPGAGKTSAVAKLAAQAALRGRQAVVATTDTVRAGAVGQLGAYTRILEQRLHTAESPNHLGACVRAAPDGAQVLIDTPGTNPYSDTELRDLKRFIAAADVEPVMVLPAGIDPAEAGEMAGIYASLGCRLAVFARLDVSRRFGSILAALEGGDISIANVSYSPSVAQALVAVNPLSLARIFTCDPEQGSDINSVGAQTA